jgi:hypothetical protein
MRHKIWAFYIKNGSIERRYRVKPNPRGPGKAVLSTKDEIEAAYPFNDWYGHGTVLKVIPKVKENKAEICPKNVHHHHLLPGNCPFCGANYGGASRWLH